MDPTHKKQPKSTPSTASATHRQRRRHPHPHPLPDPTITAPSTIQNISHRFSKLYANHKKLVSNSFKKYPHPQPDPDFEAKTNLVLDSSCIALTKSSSQHDRKGGHNLTLSVAKVVEEEEDHFLSSKTNVKEKDDFFEKPSSKKNPEKKSSLDVEKASHLMSKGLEHIEDAKGFQEGHEMRRRSSVSSIPPGVNGGRRRSFCSSQVELADFFSCTGVKVVAVDMPPFMQIHAVDCARKAHDSLEKFTSKTLAFTLKKEFDGVYGPAWHCIVGTSFGSFVTHSVGGFMYFSMDQKLYVLLFKTTVQRAE